MKADNELLRQYATTRSEEAFAELVKRHVNLVYSAAFRQVAGDAHLAHDVAQSVFTDLARKAGSLCRRDSLTGWLYTSAYYAAGKMVRGETRRREREEQFMRDPIHETGPDADWEKLRPMLDAAMHGLTETDREAVLLRYFENRPYAEVGVRLGVNANTARMRVERAVEKLRALLAKRGITAGATLASVISANAVQTAPVSLAANLVSTSLAGTATGGVFQMITATQIKLGLGALMLAGSITALVLQQHAQTELRAQNDALAQQLADLRNQATDLSNRLSAAASAQAAADEQRNELLRLRAQVTQLNAMKATQELATPRNQSVASASRTNEISQTDIVQCTFRVRYVSAPAALMRSFGFGWASAGDKASLLSEDQLKRVLTAIKEGGEIRFLDETQITTRNGGSANASLVKPVSLDGTNAYVGETLGMAAYCSANSSTITLDLLEQLNQLMGDSSHPSIQTLQTSNQVSLLSGQTIVLQTDIPAGGWLPDFLAFPDGPNKLLVFVTPTLIDAAGNRYQPKANAGQEAAIQK